MIKILDDTKSLSTLASDTTNGLGNIQPLEARVTEELNGIYEAEFTIADTDKHFADLHVGGIVKINSGELAGEQMFRIYQITKPIGGVCTVMCQHITYDLSKIAVLPFTSTGASASCSGLVSHITGGTYPFTLTTNITNTTSKYTLDIPRTFRECLGGYDGSMLDVFRGEYEWDNLAVTMKSRRGSDNGVRITYGKNLTDFNQEENIEAVYTSVLGYAVVNEQTYYGNVYHKVQSGYPKVLIVDFTTEYGLEDTPTTADLTNKAQAYATANDIEVPSVNLTISFVPLYQTDEYKNIAPLERVSLGDTVHVYFDRLGVEATARVIKTVWDSEMGRYDSIELGDAKANMNTIINNAVGEAKKGTSESKNFLEAQLNEMATLIINGLGLHRTLVPLADGGYRIYLHNKEDLASSDTQYVMSSGGFLVSTDYGQTWNAGFDSSGNAIVNSLSTITLKALEIYGSYIEGATMLFGDPNDQYINVRPLNNKGILFDGNGQIRFDTKQQFDIYSHESTSDNVGAQIQVYSNTYSGGTEGSNIGLFTRDLTTGYVGGRVVCSHHTDNSYAYIDANELGTQNEGARVRVYCGTSNNIVQLDVYSGGTYKAGITLESSGNITVNATGNINMYGNAVYFNGTQKW